jgi:hypothetical protein
VDHKVSLFQHFTYKSRPDYLRVLIDPNEEGQISDVRANIAAISSIRDKECLHNSKIALCVAKFKLAKQLPEKKKETKPSKTSCGGGGFSFRKSIGGTTHLVDYRHISSVMNDSRCRRYMKLYAARNFSSENVLFWEEVELKYKATSKRDERHKIALGIINSFLDQDNVLGINTTNDLKHEVVRRFSYEGPELDLFDNIVSDIETEVLTDIYLRFNQTELFQEMKGDTRKKRMTIHFGALK